MNPRRQVEIVAATALLKAMSVRVRPYQPVTVSGRLIAAPRRLCLPRADALLPILRAADVDTVVEHGCAEGYFVRRCAEAGMLAIGVEADAPRVLMGQVSLTVDRIEGFGFVRQYIDAESVHRLPEADATLSLSLMHHMMAQHGQEYAREMLRTIRQQTRRVLIFETGQSNEPGFWLANQLPDMGSDPHAWIAEFIESSGFRDPRIICKAPALGSEHIERATFAAYI